MARPSFPKCGTGSGAEAPSDFLPSLLPSLVAALPGPLLVIDPPDRVALASPAAAEMFDLAPDALVGTRVVDLFPDGLAGNPVRIRPRNGRDIRAEISRRSMTHEDRELSLLWLHDVTERRQSEESLKRHVEDLQQATRAKSEFVASMSHEIRTPMNAVLGMTEILLDSDLDESQRELAERVRRAGMNLLTTLNDVLDLAKVEAGQLDLASATFAIRPWLDEAIELFHAQAAGKGILVEAQVSPAVPETLHGDAPRLRQILVNLLGNAVKFTSKGGVTLQVDLPPPGDHLAFRVRDTGVGIDPSHLDRLFEPWAQARELGADDHGGTGLGLAIARKLVERMGGTIGATSQPGVGSEFHFEVPLDLKQLAHREPLGPPLHREPAPRRAI